MKNIYGNNLSEDDNDKYYYSDTTPKSEGIVNQTINTSSFTNKRDAIDFGKHNFNIIKTFINKSSKPVSKNVFYCTICNGSSEINNNNDFIILSCHHIFHIKCLAETHFKDIYNYSIIDNEYFENRKCTICSSTIQLEEIMYLHTKFLSTTKNLIQNHQSSIEDLQLKLDNIKKELRLCYDYKHKLEKEREKSKQIVSILTTII